MIKVARSIVALGAFAAIASFARADDTPTERIALLRSEIEKAHKAYLQEQESGARWDDFVKIDRPRILEILKLVEINPSFDALETLQWMTTEPGRLDAGSESVPWDESIREELHGRVISLLRARYCADARIGKICWFIGRNWNPGESGAASFLEEVAKENKDPEVHAEAVYACAYFFEDQAEESAFTENLPEELRFPKIDPTHYQDQFMEIERQGGSKALYAKAVDRFQTLVNDQLAYPGKLDSLATFGDAARSELDSINNFSVGSHPPAIIGVDLDGHPLSTESYRGKILVLSFWGSWCGPCMAMVPLERRFADKVAGKPVVLIGVNSDAEAEKGRAVAAKEGMTWPSFWNGIEGNNGRISKAWHVRGWPTVYVIDQNGVVRLRMSGYGSTYTERFLNETVGRLLMPNGS